MKFHWEVRRFGFASLLLGAAGACASADDSAFVRSFQAPDGETYYAVSLSSDNVTAPARPHDHILLVDTSASQVGEYRRQTLAVVDALLASLPATDRVSVVAIDLSSTPLTSGWVAPATAREQALPALQQRFPAGATNLLAALTAAQAQIAADRPGSLIYIGDGMSTAHLLDSAELQALVGELRGRQIPVHGMAIGPNQDVRLLGMLASQTGGLLRVDDWRDDAQTSAARIGQEFAHAVDQPVWYPSELKSPAELLPRQPLPIRADRSTVLLGRGEIEGQQITLSAADGTQKTWTLGQPQSEHGNTFLYNLWATAEQYPTLGAGIAGDNVLAFAQTAFEDHVTSLEQAGYVALQADDGARAEQIGLSIRNLDPANVRAVGLINAAAEVRLAQLENAAPADAVPADPTAAPATTDAPAVAADVAAPGATTTPDDAASPLDARRNPASDQGLINLARARQEALAQKLQGELDQTKALANQALNVDPEQALDMLERMRNTLKTATEISPDARERMLRDLNNYTQYVRNIAETQNAKLEALSLQQRINESQAQLIEKAKLDDQKMEQLVDRVRALMVDFAAGNDVAAEEAEYVSRLIVDLEPGNPLGMAAVTLTEAAGQLRKASRLRSLRQDRFLETLYQVELSHVPFPDEPPVRYPPAEVWQALTNRRKKWASVDLKQNNPNEQRIYDALEKKVDMEFIDTELTQVIQFLTERYQIPIIPDTTRLTEFGVTLDQPISLVLSGVSLKSALKLILEQLDLTYIIEDEVMKITTAEYANQLLQTRVYPVADLVIPIQPIFSGGGFGQQQGQQGQGGQQGGGFGGGGQQGGLGVNVGGGGGGGGGFFSVPPEEAPAAFDNDAINRLKKKQ